MNDEALLLTTLDNPFNPFTNFSEWKEFDENKGYFTCNLLGRMSFTSSELNEEQNKRLQILVKNLIFSRSDSVLTIGCKVVNCFKFN